MPNVTEELLERAKRASAHIPHIVWTAYDDGEHFTLGAIVVDTNTNRAGQFNSHGTITAALRADPGALSRYIESVITTMIAEIDAGPPDQPPATHS